jgi:hypothetical protein
MTFPSRFPLKSDIKSLKYSVFVQREFQDLNPEGGIYDPFQKI